MSDSTLPLGIDVSDYQGRIDWKAVKNSGIVFAIIKATEGTRHVQTNFEYNWKSAQDVGIYRGAYHFARPSRNNATDEAYHFMNILESKGGGLQTGDIIAQDVEDPDFTGDVDAWSIYFMQLMNMLTGYNPIYYTGPWYINSRQVDSPLLKDYALWLASYRQTLPPTPPPWDTITFWQFSDKGSIPGIEGDVDLNRFNGAAERIPLLGKPAPQQEPPQPKPTNPLAKELMDRVEYINTRIITVKKMLNEISDELPLIKSIADSF